MSGDKNDAWEEEKFRKWLNKLEDTYNTYLQNSNGILTENDKKELLFSIQETLELESNKYPNFLISQNLKNKNHDINRLASTITDIKYFLRHLSFPHVLKSYEKLLKDVFDINVRDLGNDKLDNIVFNEENDGNQSFSDLDLFPVTNENSAKKKNSVSNFFEGLNKGKRDSIVDICRLADMSHRINRVNSHDNQQIKMFLESENLRKETTDKLLHERENKVLILEGEDNEKFFENSLGKLESCYEEIGKDLEIAEEEEEEAKKAYEAAIQKRKSIQQKAHQLDSFMDTAKTQKDSLIKINSLRLDIDRYNKTSAGKRINMYEKIKGYLTKVKEVFMQERLSSEIPKLLESLTKFFYNGLNGKNWEDFEENEVLKMRVLIGLRVGLETIRLWKQIFSYHSGIAEFQNSEFQNSGMSRNLTSCLDLFQGNLLKELKKVGKIDLKKLLEDNENTGENEENKNFRKQQKLLNYDNSTVILYFDHLYHETPDSHPEAQARVENSLKVLYRRATVETTQFLLGSANKTSNSKASKKRQLQLLSCNDVVAPPTWVLSLVHCPNYLSQLWAMSLVADRGETYVPLNFDTEWVSENPYNSENEEKNIITKNDKVQINKSSSAILANIIKLDETWVNALGNENSEIFTNILTPSNGDQQILKMIKKSENKFFKGNNKSNSGSSNFWNSKYEVFGDNTEEKTNSVENHILISEEELEKSEESQVKVTSELNKSTNKNSRLIDLPNSVKDQEGRFVYTDLNLHLIIARLASQVKAIRNIGDLIGLNYSNFSLWLHGRTTNGFTKTLENSIKDWLSHFEKQDLMKLLEKFENSKNQENEITLKQSELFLQELKKLYQEDKIDKSWNFHDNNDVNTETNKNEFKPQNDEISLIDSPKQKITKKRNFQVYNGNNVEDSEISNSSAGNKGLNSAEQERMTNDAKILRDLMQKAMKSLRLSVGGVANQFYKFFRYGSSSGVVSAWFSYKGNDTTYTQMTNCALMWLEVQQESLSKSEQTQLRALSKRMNGVVEDTASTSIPKSDLPEANATSTSKSNGLASGKKKRSKSETENSEETESETENMKTGKNEKERSKNEGFKSPPKKKMLAESDNRERQNDEKVATNPIPESTDIMMTSGDSENPENPFENPGSSSNNPFQKEVVTEKEEEKDAAYYEKEPTGGWAKGGSKFPMPLIEIKTIPDFYGSIVFERDRRKLSQSKIAEEARLHEINMGQPNLSKFLTAKSLNSNERGRQFAEYMLKWIWRSRHGRFAEPSNPAVKEVEEEVGGHNKGEGNKFPLPLEEIKTIKDLHGSIIFEMERRKISQLKTVQEAKLQDIGLGQPALSKFLSSASLKNNDQAREFTEYLLKWIWRSRKNPDCEGWNPNLSTVHLVPPGQTANLNLNPNLGPNESNPNPNDSSEPSTPLGEPTRSTEIDPFACGLCGKRSVDFANMKSFHMHISWCYRRKNSMEPPADYKLKSTQNLYSAIAEKKRKGLAGDSDEEPSIGKKPKKGEDPFPWTDNTSSPADTFTDGDRYDLCEICRESDKKGDNPLERCAACPCVYHPTCLSSSVDFSEEDRESPFLPIGGPSGAPVSDFWCCKKCTEIGAHTAEELSTGDKKETPASLEGKWVLVYSAGLRRWRKGYVVSTGASSGKAGLLLVKWWRSDNRGGKSNWLDVTNSKILLSTAENPSSRSRSYNSTSNSTSQVTESSRAVTGKSDSVEGNGGDATKEPFSQLSRNYYRNTGSSSMQMDGISEGGVPPLALAAAAGVGGIGALQGTDMDGKDSGFSLNGMSDTYVSSDSLKAALCAAGTACRAVDIVFNSNNANAFACTRPPGHHAGRYGCTSGCLSTGFCLLNNAAIAAVYARVRWMVDRVAVVDIDVHFGNGTAEILKGDPQAFFGSVHMIYGSENDGMKGQELGLSGEQEGRRGKKTRRSASKGFYPTMMGQTEISDNYVSVGVFPPEKKKLNSKGDKNGLSEGEEEEEKGKNKKTKNPGLASYNPSGSAVDVEKNLNGPFIGAEGFLRALKNVLIPKMEKFKPDLLIISAGFDGFVSDPLGGELQLSKDHYKKATLMLMESMCKLNGKVVSLLEGGYDTSPVTAGLAKCVDVHVQTLQEGP